MRSLPLLRGFDKARHHVVAAFELVAVQNRERQPGAELAGAHRAGTMVKYLNQRHSVATGRGEYFQVALGETVHPDETPLVDAGDRADIVQAGVMGLFQIHQKCPGGTNAQRIRIHGVAFQRCGFQLFAQAFGSCFPDKRPFVDGGNVPVVAENRACGLFRAACYQQLLRMERRQKRCDIVRAALGDLESARRYVQEGGAALFFLEGKAGQEIVFLLLEHLVAEGDAGGDELGDAALDKLLPGELRVFQLVAYGGLVAGADEFRQIHVEGMVGESGHGHGLLVAV